MSDKPICVACGMPIDGEADESGNDCWHAEEADCIEALCWEVESLRAALAAAQPAPCLADVGPSAED